MIGIYCIENTENNKKYVGQSSDITHRWRHHKSDLRNDRHHNKHLQGAWNKYGESNFIFYILEECELELLDEKEIHWIKELDSYENGYNLDRGGLGCRGYKHTDEEIRKMRQIANPKPVLQLDMKLNIVKRWESSSQASKYLNLHKRCIDSICNRIKHQKSYKGFIWVYEDDYKNNTVDVDYYLNNNAKNKMKVSQYDKQMNLIKMWNSITEASKALNIHSGEICNVCNGKKNTYKGYIWIYTDEPDRYYSGCEARIKQNEEKKIAKKKLIYQYDKSGTFIRTFTQSELIDCGFNLAYVQSACSGHIKTHKNYIWKYS